jgi:hypothetical protein
MLSTFLLITLAWIFFRAENVTVAINYISNLFSMSIFTIPQKTLERGTVKQGYQDVILDGRFIKKQANNANGMYVYQSTVVQASNNTIDQIMLPIRTQDGPVTTYIVDVKFIGMGSGQKLNITWTQGFEGKPSTTITLKNRYGV